jgi:hypothetical protein
MCLLESASRRSYVGSRYPNGCIIMSKFIALILAATALAGCCVSGHGCYSPLPGVPLAWQGFGPAPTETVQLTEDRPSQLTERPRKATRSRKEIIVGPIGEMAAEPKRKLEGIDALVQQEAADRADEEKLAKRLMICSNCLPARSNDDATGRSTR